MKNGFSWSTLSHPWTRDHLWMAMSRVQFYELKWYVHSSVLQPRWLGVQYWFTKVYFVLHYTTRPPPPINDWNKLKPTIILLYLQSADCSCMYLLGLLRFLFLLSFQYLNICVLNTNSSRPVVTHSIHVVSFGLCCACFLQVGGQSMTRHFFCKMHCFTNLHFP